MREKEGESRTIDGLHGLQPSCQHVLDPRSVSWAEEKRTAPRRPRDQGSHSAPDDSGSGFSSVEVYGKGGGEIPGSLGAGRKGRESNRAAADSRLSVSRSFVFPRFVHDETKGLTGGLHGRRARQEDLPRPVRGVLPRGTPSYFASPGASGVCILAVASQLRRDDRLFPAR